MVLVKLLIYLNPNASYLDSSNIGLYTKCKDVGRERLLSIGNLGKFYILFNDKTRKITRLLSVADEYVLYF